MGLSAKMLKFVAVYDGNGTRACELAGYKGSKAVLGTQAHRLLKNAEIKKALKARESKELEPAVKTRKERQAYWSRMMDSAAKDADRLKASELLGRSEGDFTQKIELKGELTLEALITAASQPEGT